jgi:hypothetical protein
VNFIEGRNLKEFFLVAEFSRSRIKLNSESVRLILQPCFGGHASRFKVSYCQNWSFMFSVVSKDVGLVIYQGDNIANQNFTHSFCLWGFVGPDYAREFELYCCEEDVEWTRVFWKGKSKSYAQVVQSPRFFDRLHR